MPRDSACFRAVNPDHEHTHTLELLRSVDVSARWLVWAQTKDGASGRNVPEPYPFPWEPEPDNGGWRGDSMTIEEADLFLGWTHLKAV